ncbi:hypothetical protein [Roseicella sp. DB1501]|uniref:hypothetical protein n=1 Tax=Roseicella sp. DB1501 TaxID=2730925 RepID=UPI0014911599|nr:hypothetical protein [Roseicella sp. DB1501]NOG74219.1 hypothetical protein [Roseicella sp. DB1501]
MWNGLSVAQFPASAPATPATVADHLAKRLSTIGQYHRLAGHAFSTTQPVIHHTLHGIHRRHGHPARRAVALPPSNPNGV